MTYKLHITETGRNNTREEAHTFNIDIQYFKTLDEVKQHLTDRYGRLPTRTASNTIYQDTKDGGRPVGFTHSFWNADMSHAPVDKWYQTDWIEVTEVNKTVVLIK